LRRRRKEWRFWWFRLPLMIIGETDVKDYRPAKKRVEVSVGEIRAHRS